MYYIHTGYIVNGYTWSGYKRALRCAIRQQDIEPAICENGVNP